VHIGLHFALLSTLAFVTAQDGVTQPGSTGEEKISTIAASPEAPAPSAEALTASPDSAPPLAADALAASPEAPVPPSPVGPAAPPAAVEPPARTWRDLVTLEGLLDTSFHYKIGGSAREPSQLRVFDAGGNDTFNLALAKLGLGISGERLGMRIDLGFGSVIDAVNYSEGNIPFLEQGYLTVSLPAGLTLDVGKFVTNAGAEVIEAHKNWNYSRSILFGYAIPFVHTGVRLNAPLGKDLTLIGSVVSGWDNDLDGNVAKTLGLTVLYSLPTGTSLALTTYDGTEAAEWRYLLDLVVTQELGPAALSLNADWGAEGDARWYGAALAARYSLGDSLRVALRGEYFRDPQGVRNGLTRPNPDADPNDPSTAVLPFGALGWGEVTATVSVPMGSNVELRAESRFDFADGEAFTVGGQPRRNQKTFHLAALAWF